VHLEFGERDDSVGTLIACDRERRTEREIETEGERETERQRETDREKSDQER
jgi:hypothetical protein